MNASYQLLLLTFICDRIYRNIFQESCWLCKQNEIKNRKILLLNLKFSILCVPVQNAKDEAKTGVVRDHYSSSSVSSHHFVCYANEIWSDIFNLFVSRVISFPSVSYINEFKL